MIKLIFFESSVFQMTIGFDGSKRTALSLKDICFLYIHKKYSIVFLNTRYLGDGEWKEIPFLVRVSVFQWKRAVRVGAK